jgi:uncharacterized protein (TIGR02598 family)
VKLNDQQPLGFSLVEVTLALGVAAFCLIAVFGLLPVGIQTNRTATSETNSSQILTRVIADLRATPPTIPRGAAATSVEFGISIPANPVMSSQTIQTLYFAEDGTFADSVQPTSRVRLTITFLPNDPGGVLNRLSTRVFLKATWPAAADPATASGSCEAFVSLNRN